MAAVDLFLEIDGIAGDSTDRDHRGAVEALAFSWAEHLQVSSGGGGGGGVGKVAIGELQVVARTSSASPLLMLACATGRHHATARLSSRRSGEGARDSFVITLHDAIVTGYRVGATESGEDDVPTDQVSLAFGRIEIEVRTQNAKGGAGPTVRAGWDVAEHASFTPTAAAATRATKPSTATRASKRK